MAKKQEVEKENADLKAIIIHLNTKNKELENEIKVLYEKMQTLMNDNKKISEELSLAKMQIKTNNLDSNSRFY